MKRISLFLIAMIVLASADLKSQAPAATGASLINYSGLESKLKKSDEDIVNPKKNTKAKTWTNRAQVLIDIYGIHNTLLTKGLEPGRAKVYMGGDPKEVKTYQEAGNAVEVYSYDRVDLKFVNGKLDKAIEKNKIHPDPLPEAQKALDEAIKLNTDGKATEDIKKVTLNLKQAYQTEAINDYEDTKFNESYQNFSNILNLNKLPFMNNQIDTVLIYFAGRAAFEDKNYAEASRLFEEASNYNYNDPLLWVFRKQALFALGDTAKGVEVIKEAFSKYPEEQTVMYEMINYYLDSEQGDQALELINKAKQSDPKNVSLVFTQGTLYDKMGNTDGAEKAYKQCIEMNPEYYDAYYNLGVLYYNEAVKIYEEASNISDNAAFEKKQASGDEALKLAIPYMEKVGNMEAKDQNAFDTKRSALETLKTIYYRLKMEDKRQEVINKLNSL